MLNNWLSFLFFLKILFTFRERRGEEREKERERNINVWEIHQSVASRMPPTGDPTSNPGMRPDWESNQWPFSSQASAQSTETHQPGHDWLSRGKKSLVYNICQFPWCKYFHHGQFQATNMTSLNEELGRNVHIQLCELVWMKLKIATCIYILRKFFHFLFIKPPSFLEFFWKEFSY